MKIVRIILSFVATIVIIVCSVMTIVYTINMKERVNEIKSGFVYKDQSKTGYAAWPTCAYGDGKIFCAFSGGRLGHVKGNGKIYFAVTDENKIDFKCRVIFESDIDERDCGITYLGNGKLILTVLRYDRTKKWYGSGYMTSNDYGKTWSEMKYLDVTSPHGIVKLKSGKLIWLGKDHNTGEIESRISSDNGDTWEKGSPMPLPSGTKKSNFHEPTCIELSDGTLLGAVRYQSEKGGQYHKVSFFYMRSYDGGLTWSDVKYSGVNGTPPHLLLHSSGKVICAYGRRVFPYGVRVLVSSDNGNTFDKEYILDSQYSWDFGYPASVELKDGSIFTVYYGKPHFFSIKPNIMYKIWKL